jgi:hypothetical protein
MSTRNIMKFEGPQLAHPPGEGERAIHEGWVEWFGFARHFHLDEAWHRLQGHAA